MYVYEIKNWNPVNTNSFNLLTKIKITPDIKLLELFKLAPLNNILCKISETNSDYDRVTYGTIDKDSDDYYITIDLIWKSYPDADKMGKIEFLDKTVYKTIEYLTIPNASPVILESDNFDQENSLDSSSPSKSEQKTELGPLKLGYNGGDLVNGELVSQFCSNPRMKLNDLIIPVGVALILTYIFFKEFSK